MESGCTHGRLQNLHLQQVGSLNLTTLQLLYDWLQSIFHCTLGQHLWSIERGRLLAITAIQTVDKLAPRMNDVMTFLIFQYLIFLKHVTTRTRLQIRFHQITLRMHLDIIFFSIEATISQKILIHTPQLVDAQIGIRDTSTRLTLLFLRQRQLANNALPYNITELDTYEHFQLSIREQRRVDMAHTERGRHG